MAGKQAKILSQREIGQVLGHIRGGRYPLRNEVMFLLSVKAGLRAKEISCLTWSMVTDASGQIGEVIHLPDNSSKGKSGRIIPLNLQLKQALIDLYQSLSPTSDQYIIPSERGPKMLPCNISHWFKGVFKALRLEGCSSHSGRRTFVTNAARRIIEVGGSLRDVQQLAGHTSLQMTQSYIEGDSEAKRKVVQLI
ncbi:MAG: site-specific integrase [Alphaproteobacteria bacterium]|nr:site-specific integrase [Alphaproteobacteria bacterium]